MFSERHLAAHWRVAGSRGGGIFQNHPGECSQQIVCRGGADLARLRVLKQHVYFLLEPSRKHLTLKTVVLKMCTSVVWGCTLVTTKFKVINFLPTNLIRNRPFAMILLVSPKNSMHPFNLTSRLFPGSLPFKVNLKMKHILLTFTEFSYSVLVEHNEYTSLGDLWLCNSLQLLLHSSKT